MFKSFLGIHEKSDEDFYKLKLISFCKIPEEFISYHEITTVSEKEYIHAVIIDDKTVLNKALL